MPVSPAGVAATKPGTHIHAQQLHESRSWKFETVQVEAVYPRGTCAHESLRPKLSQGYGRT